MVKWNNMFAANARSLKSTQNFSKTSGKSVACIPSVKSVRKPQRNDGLYDEQDISVAMREIITTPTGKNVRHLIGVGPSKTNQGIRFITVLPACEKESLVVGCGMPSVSERSLKNHVKCVGPNVLRRITQTIENRIR